MNSENLILRQNSNITANARGENVIGGNININAQVLVALENSDISANSQDSRGGRVNINTSGIFGTQNRSRPSDLTSDITATSERGAEFSGIVTVNAPDLDPTAALVPLNASLLDPSQQIVSGCEIAEENSFTVVGRGGIPASPTDPLFLTRSWVDLGQRNPENGDRTPTPPDSSRTPVPYVEATQWQLNDRGQVVLVAANPTASQLDPTCSDLR
ncbi:S-layer family protein [Phormidium sp. CCY1219]|uniref:S-layer family protein n=1 Tax=Phormidium sp. CCY1219 TaxID=2886104 RepID=UPI002D1EF8D0|nr:S-layer family protein [Phormidium sp. CCY1219]MEB3825898.1 S-layer family protein [Phormidium sp. CCY1219]